MQQRILITQARIVNEGRIMEADVYVKNGLIEKIGGALSVDADLVIDARGNYLFPGVIDDQVHFREPGLTQKATIYTESKAAVAGGVTTFMEMPNTVPNALTQALLADKYQIASQTSLANYSFFMGASNDNLDEVLKTDSRHVCGIKIFMGSSTGNMLVDNERTLENIFSKSPMLIAVHCEDEATIRANAEKYKAQYGNDIPVRFHPVIRNEEACLKSSAMAVALAKKHNTRLHILHISTADELNLFTNAIPLTQKRITSEVCVHHLWFDADDYETLGTQIKCNPAIKDKRHKKALLEALLDDRLDIIATDHAPHTWQEKQQTYWQAPSGVPLVQHALPMMLEFYRQGKLSLEKIAEKMSHAPAQCFQIERRGFIREGYWADLALVDLATETLVTADRILYKCGWSPFTGHSFQSAVTHTLVSGHLVYANGQFDERSKGQRLLFER
ncbi:dihydroorotase [Rhodocytophaga aerolata]|uniref:Dihydroorotase n=1 Tax=Rhodocytophaga aerolata TaxID=455078 RepID=A0ABT8R596_9BACT|nr:dihydroorotase [Rhodocytophaga aerolata]MDO1447271.1 dihydroorotase [Rhodocytophaga aerolata]